MKRLGAKDVADGSRIISSKNGGNDTLAALRQLRQDRNMCDVVIKVNGEEILAHRNVLAINSQYFRSMFAQGFSEAQAREITLMDDSIDPTSARTLIDFMYSGNLTVIGNSVQGLIMAADLWHMTEVKKLCEDYMERLIDANNCLGIERFGKVYSCTRLVQRSQHLVKQRFPLVVQSNEFLHLSPTELHDILKATDLNLGHEGEDVVVRALFRWLECHPHLPSAEWSPLLTAVHWSAVSLPCRRQYLQHPALTSHPDPLQLMQSLIEAKTDGSRQPQTTLYVMGGYLQSRTGPKCPRLRSVEKLDSLTRKWAPCADLPMLSSAAVAFNLHGHLFYCACEPVTVAHSRNTVTRTDIFEYSIMRDEWLPADSKFSVEIVECIDSCLQAEGALAVCPQSSAIYLVSHSEVAVINVSLINGDIVCPKVQLLPRPLDYFTQQQRSHAAIMLDGSLYVVGGDRHDAGPDPVATARVIVFDPVQKQWASRANMLEPRVRPAVAALKGKLYANGGFNTRRLASMECYDPATDQWTQLTAMNKYRSHHQLLVLHNSLWAIGGKSYAVSNGGARKVLNLCEVYNPDSNTWTEEEDQHMKHARCAFAAVAI